MSSPGSAPAIPVTHKRQLVSWLETGSKPRERWRIGTEHEKFLFDRETLAPIPYEGERGIRVLLDEMLAFRWQKVEEAGNLIGLRRGEATISLEPGGQLELSGAQFGNLHETAAELAHHLDELGSVGRVLGLGSLGMGFQPRAGAADVPFMPKGRYAFMRTYMPKVGGLGLDMMQRTCTVQVNLDFADERDMIRKLRVSLALQPVVTALFASSPFREGRPTGDTSTRMRCWLDTDPARTDPLEFVHHPDFGFERYVDWALSVPMYFVYRNGLYHDAGGGSFNDFMQGRLSALPGETASLADWETHLSTLFPPVRLRRYLEMRGADMGSADMALALPALWTGLLYDDIALDEAEVLLGEWSADDRQALYRASPALTLDSPAAGSRTVGAVARDMIAIAGRGLARRAIADPVGGLFDESAYLRPLQAIVDLGLTQSEDMLRRYFDEWGQSVDPLFTVLALT